MFINCTLWWIPAGLGFQASSLPSLIRARQPLWLSVTPLVAHARWGLWIPTPSLALQHGTRANYHRTHVLGHSHHLSGEQVTKINTECIVSKFWWNKNLSFLYFGIEAMAPETLASLWWPPWARDWVRMLSKREQGWWWVELMLCMEDPLSLGANASPCCQVTVGFYCLNINIPNCYKQQIIWNLPVLFNCHVELP